MSTAPLAGAAPILGHWVDHPAPIDATRAAAWKKFLSQGFPSPDDESYREINLTALADLQIMTATPTQPQASRFAFAATRLDLQAGRIGALPLLPPGVTVESRDIPPPPFGLMEDDPFHQLNQALSPQPILIRIAPGVALEQPLWVCHRASFDAPGGSSIPQLRVLVGAGADATVIETFEGGEELLFECAVTELQVEPNARLTHLRWQADAGGTTHVGRVAARLERDARLTLLDLSNGAGCCRNDVSVALDAPGAEAQVNGVSFVERQERLSNFTTIEHRAPQTSSRELYRTILDGASSSSFRGRIIVAEGAQQTDAKQSNGNLLLSERALAQTRPQLEIYADDVRCTHGATIGQLDREAIFYLQSRGLDRSAALAMLIEAFVLEVVPDRLPVTVRNAITTHFARLGATSAT